MGKETSTPQERFYHCLYNCFITGVLKCKDTVDSANKVNSYDEVTNVYRQIAYKDWVKDTYNSNIAIDGELCDAIADELLNRAKKENFDVKTAKQMNFMCVSSYNSNFIDSDFQAKLIVSVLYDIEYTDNLTVLDNVEHTPENIKEFACVILDGYIQKYTDTITKIINAKLGISTEEME